MTCFIKQRGFTILIMNRESLNEFQEETKLGDDGELISLGTRSSFENKFPLSLSSRVFATVPF